jgi:hypothetical protein
MMFFHGSRISQGGRDKHAHTTESRKESQADLWEGLLGNSCGRSSVQLPALGKCNSGPLRLAGRSHRDPIDSNVCSVPKSVTENSSMVLDIPNVTSETATSSRFHRNSSRRHRNDLFQCRARSQESSGDSSLLRQHVPKTSSEEKIDEDNAPAKEVQTAGKLKGQCSNKSDGVIDE